PAITNCTISGNSAEDGGGLAGCDGAISNCIVVNNWAASQGGGMDCCVGVIDNCTISDNSAEVSAGGLHWCWAMIYSCIVWGNEAPEIPEVEGYWETTYCCIRGWTYEGEGNISADPLFVSGPLGDYYLSQMSAGQAADSPCIDAGSALAVEMGLAEMTTRTDEMPDVGIVDIGFHYPASEDAVDVEVICSLNSEEFTTGDVLEAFASLENRGADIIADIFAAIVLPDGSVISHTQSGFAPGIWPWLSEVILTSGFSSGPSEVFELCVPTGAAVGSYSYVVAVSRPGMVTPDFLSIHHCTFHIR
ncbi:MAG: hypothetical protein JW941_12710, partial [Candidatus Coatesbacteria bacterium]|nr:hypothetical protein [Candidatus Coatesbacteria bacterium]